MRITVSNCEVSILNFPRISKSNRLQTENFLLIF